MRSTAWMVGLVVAGALAVGSAQAAGPVDVKLGAAYWDSDVEVDGVSEGAGDIGAWLEIETGKWAFAGSYWVASPDATDIKYTAFDVKFRFFEPSEGNFIAIGLGGEQIAFSGTGVDDDITAARLVAEGGVSIKIVRLYGRYAWLPDIGDLETGFGTLKGDSGTEAEVGVAVQPLPFFSINAGYKLNELDFDDGTSLETSGPYAGVSFRF